MIPPLLLLFIVAPKSWIPSVMFSKNAMPDVWVFSKVHGDGPNKVVSSYAFSSVNMGVTVPLKLQPKVVIPENLPDESMTNDAVSLFPISYRSIT